MRAYWFDNKEGDQRAPHDSGKPVDDEYLMKIGVMHYNCPTISDVDEIAQKRGYVNRDEIVISPEKMGDAYEGKVKMFFNEHLHDDEEIRYIMDGSGYFDVRGKDDDWIRLQLDKNDLMIMPAGIYHRFTTDEDNYIKAMRLFQNAPNWTPYNRGQDTDKSEVRQGYLHLRDGSSPQ